MKMHRARARTLALTLAVTATMLVAGGTAASAADEPPAPGTAVERTFHSQMLCSLQRYLTELEGYAVSPCQPVGSPWFGPYSFWTYY